MRSALILALVMITVGCTVEATESLPMTQDPGRSKLGGTVLETIDASTYTYVRFETPDGEAWAAVPQARLELGARVVIANPQPMSNFESKTLGRRFETIYFGTIEGAGASPAAAAQRQADAAGPSDTPIVVSKAGGASGRTVAELYADSGALAGATVTLRGQVVKYNAGIMGRNWIHLQDGSGDTNAGTNDITVTTSATAAVGDVILVQGTVVVDRDFGAGYRYAVIVEDAVLQ